MIDTTVYRTNRPDFSSMGWIIVAASRLFEIQRGAVPPGHLPFNRASGACRAGWAGRSQFPRLQPERPRGAQVAVAVLVMNRERLGRPRTNGRRASARLHQLLQSRRLLVLPGGRHASASAQLVGRIGSRRAAGGGGRSRAGSWRAHALRNRRPSTRSGRLSLPVAAFVHVAGGGTSRASLIHPTGRA